MSTSKKGSKPPARKDIVIPVMGATGAGKSFFINTLLRENGMTVGKDLKSCTSKLGFGYLENVEGYPNHRIVLVDTPGFDDTVETDFQILETIATWLKDSYKKGSKLGGVIYLHDISSPRFTGTARRNLQMFRSLCGENALEHVILGTTKWVLNVPDSERRYDQLQGDDYWGPLIDKGAKVGRFDNSYDSAWKFINAIIKKDIVILIMGATGAGKSFFINTLLQQERMKVAKNSKPCTNELGFGYLENVNEYPDYRIVLVDTPGFDGTEKTDIQILKTTATWLKESYKKGSKLGGVIYLRGIREAAPLKGTDGKNLQRFRNLCGENALDHVVLGTTQWVPNVPDCQKHYDLLQGDDHWGPLIYKGAKVGRFDNTCDSAWKFVKNIISGDTPEALDEIVLLIQEELVNKKMILPETLAAQDVRFTLNEVLAIQKKLQRLDVDGSDDLQAQRKEAQVKVELLKTQLKNLKIPLLRKFKAWFS